MSDELPPLDHIAKPSLDALAPLSRVEMHRIEGDVYINGKRSIFAVDSNQSAEPVFENVDWLISWAKIGLMSKGHNVPHFPAGRKDQKYGRDLDQPAE